MRVKREVSLYIIKSCLSSIDPEVESTASVDRMWYYAFTVSCTAIARLDFENTKPSRT